MEIAKETWRDKASIQQVFFILVSAMIALNASGLEYMGPVFGTWVGDVTVVLAFLLAVVYMRTHDQKHQENMMTVDSLIRGYDAEIKRLELLAHVDFKQLNEQIRPVVDKLLQVFEPAAPTGEHEVY